MHQHVDVLVDRAGDQEAAVLAVVGGQVGAAAAERDPQRRSAEDDAHHGPGLRGPRAPTRTDWHRTSRASLDRLADALASAPSREPASRCTRGGSAGCRRPTRACHRCTRAAGATPMCSQMMAIESLTITVSSRPEVVRADLARMRFMGAPPRSGSPRRSHRRTGTTSAGGRRRGPAGASGSRLRAQ